VVAALLLGVVVGHARHAGPVLAVPDGSAVGHVGVGENAAPLDDALHGEEGPASEHAAVAVLVVVLAVALQDVLDREVDEVAAVDLLLALEVAHGGEDPASAERALVLHRRDGALLSSEASAKERVGGGLGYGLGGWNLPSPSSRRSPGCR
jgi:hypothetical protein